MLLKGKRHWSSIKWKLIYCPFPLLLHKGCSVALDFLKSDSKNYFRQVLLVVAKYCSHVRIRSLNFGTSIIFIFSRSMEEDYFKILLQDVKLFVNSSKQGSHKCQNMMLDLHLCPMARWQTSCDPTTLQTKILTSSQANTPTLKSI